MAERRTTGAGQHIPATAADGGSSRSQLARGSDALPFRPYVYRGGEPEAVTRAREQHRALDEEIERRRALAAAVAETAGPGPDDAGYEWRREQLLEDG